MTGEMTAAVIYEPGGPEVLRLERRPIPRPASGEVLIRVRAFGLNRSELFTRQGHSPGVAFPRMLGIEAVGEVAAAPGAEFAEGDIVATAMGGLGRQFDGSYAEFTLVPAHHIQKLDTTLDWKVLGAIPEMLQNFMMQHIIFMSMAKKLSNNITGMFVIRTLMVANLITEPGTIIVQDGARELSPNGLTMI